jgi:hypothetical protein
MRRVFEWIGTGIVLIILISFFGSCTSAPEGSNSTVGTPKKPEWVENPPTSTDNTVYFTGSGTAAEEEGPARAERNAIRAVIDSIIDRLGIEVADSTTIKAQDTLNKYTSRLEEALSIAAGETGGAVHIADRYVEKQDNTITVFLLAAYDRSELRKEREMLWKVFFEHEDAVVRVEQRGNALYNEGYFYQAAVAYLEAAAQAFTSSIYNSDLVVRTNLRKAADSVNRIEITTENNNLATKVGVPFQSPFLVKVTNGRNGPGSALAEVPIVVTYRKLTDDGNLETDRKYIQTSGQGIAAFYRPAPQFVGSETLTMQIDLSMHLEPLRDLSAGLASEVGILEEVVRSKEAEFRYTSLSRAKEIPTGVLFIETDRAGTPQASNDAAVGVMERLSAAGFQAELLPPTSLALQRLDHEQIVNRTKDRFSGRIERLIYGVCGISNFSDANGMYTVEVTGTVTAVDFKTGRIVYSGTNSKRSRGSNIRTAISVAFKGLGQEFGEVMIEELP